MKKIRKKALLYFLLISCVLFSPMKTFAEEVKTEGCAISIALDVSGSMKTTDEKKFSIELIKLFIDIADEEDYISITAYNDTIVYESGMQSMKSEASKDALKQALDKIEFQGETDNGLGMYTATKALEVTKGVCENAFVLMVTDGNTDLANSTTDRTIEDSNADLQKSGELAEASGAVINVIEYTNEYMQDTSLLSVVTAATDGSTIIVNEPTQFIQVMLSTFFTEYNGGKVKLEMSQTESLLNRSEIELETKENTSYYTILFATEAIQDMEMLGENQTVDYKRGTYYAVAEDATLEKLTAIYSFQQNATVLSGVIEAELPVEEPATEEVVPETEAVKETEAASTEVSIMTEPIVEEPDVKEIVYKIVVIIIILLIIAATATICVVIVKKLLFQKNEPSPEISGFLEAKFIDLKSRNESKDVKWNLREYPSAGVSLAELFAGKQIKEDLKDLDKVCFYPSDKRNELLLVHCMEGGVFIGEQLIRANKPAKVKDGDVIYLSFADNASEIALKYSIVEL